MNTEDPTTAPTDPRSHPDPAPAERYEIRVDGRLGSRWSAWFDGLGFAREDDGTTCISGPVADQAALHGLLHKLRDLGLTLLSLRRLDADDAAPAATDLPHDPTLHPSPGAPS